LAARLGHRGDQEAALRRLQKDFPGHRLARHAALDLAKVAIIRSNWTDAVVLARDAAQSDDLKVRVEASLLVGEAELKLRRFPDALKSFESIGNAESVDPWIRYRALAGLGIAHEQLQQFRSALTAYESVTRNSPDAALRNWALRRLTIVKARLASTP
jgi:tetratricopeptide (TPR) repeat protein